jgi:hypothetical protein
MLWVNGNGHLNYSNDQTTEGASVRQDGWLAGWLAIHIRQVARNSFALFLWPCSS